MSRLSFVQYRPDQQSRAVAAVIDNEPPRRLAEIESMYNLAQLAAQRGISITEALASLKLMEAVDLAAAASEGRFLAPIDHPDIAHLYVTGTGLTHLGSAEGRDAMHSAMADPSRQTDSMRMFLMGVEGGKPTEGGIGVQPEWFYKGNGDCVVGSGAPLVSPAFAQSAGEEPELAGIYLIGHDGTPLRLGFCLANEFSDHVTERANYLWLAHSKLRPIALGPELLTGPLPEEVRGAVRIWRDGAVMWGKPFLSGEANMSHSIANLEYHHFKYKVFRRPGDVHVHVFGTATLSFSDGVMTAPGDVFEIEAAPFRWPLRNELKCAVPVPVQVRAL
jgi:hypothetical protein